MTNPGDAARDVIARVVNPSVWNAERFADDILAALDAAGFAVVKREKTPAEMRPGDTISIPCEYVPTETYMKQEDGTWWKVPMFRLDIEEDDDEDTV